MAITALRLAIPNFRVNSLGNKGVNIYDWRVRIHDLIAKGFAEARRDNGWTQEQTANVSGVTGSVRGAPALSARLRRACAGPGLTRCS